MKLIYARCCKDVVTLHMVDRTCLCGKAGGRYLLDGLHAVIWGECVPLGILNNSLALAITSRPFSGLGREFTAFVIPEQCDTVEHKESK